MIKQLNLLICVFMIDSCRSCSQTCYLFGSWLFPFAIRGIRCNHHYLAYLVCHLAPVLWGLRRLHLITFIAKISLPSDVFIWIVEYIWRKLCITFFGGYHPCHIICIVLFVKRHLLMRFSKRLQRFLRITKIDYCGWVQIVPHQLLGEL